jgi:hypothetical protein
MCRRELRRLVEARLPHGVFPRVRRLNAGRSAAQPGHLRDGLGQHAATRWLFHPQQLMHTRAQRRGSWNAGRTSDPALNALVEKIAVEMDPARRTPAPRSSVLDPTGPHRVVRVEPFATKKWSCPCLWSGVYASSRAGGRSPELGPGYARISGFRSPSSGCSGAEINDMGVLSPSALCGLTSLYNSTLGRPQDHGADAVVSVAPLGRSPGPHPRLGGERRRHRPAVQPRRERRPMS